MIAAGDHFTASHALRLLHDPSIRRLRLPEILSGILRHHLHHLLPDLAAAAASLRRVSFTRRLLLLSPNPDLPLFNAAIKSLSFLPSSSEPFRLLALLRSAGLRPDRRTFVPILKSSSLLPSAIHGSAVHAAAVVAGFDAHAAVATQLVELYAQFGLMTAARKVFDEMPLRETVVWNMMINGFCRLQDLETATLLFREMRSRNIITWNTMLAGLSRAGRHMESVELFSELLDSGVEPDEATFATILPACSRIGNSELGRRIHVDAKNRGLLVSVNVGNSLIDMYCKCGETGSARKVFDEMPVRNVVTWNAMINGLAINGHGGDGLRLFDEMRGRGAEPNSSTFVGVLGCCAHAGLEERVRGLFRAMKAEHGIEPGPEHYGCLVDLLGRCGRTGEALEVIKGMPMKPTAAIWGALLSACRNNGDVEVGEAAARELAEAEPENSGNFVLLANLYAEAGRWEEAEKVWSAMREMRVWKNTAQSSVIFERVR